MRILVVDDEPNLASYVAKNLRAEGFQVDWTPSGETALELMCGAAYDAVSLDIMLPDMSGYEVCARARKLGSAVPILMLTAKDGEGDEVSAFEAGADDFLRKPFSMAVLVARLKSVIRRGAGQNRSTLRVGDLTLNKKSLEAQRAGERIPLTPREYALLELLMGNPGTVLSKSRIMQHVWGADYGADDNVIEVYIGYLRKKVDAPFATPLIRTVRGRGYLIEDPGEAGSAQAGSAVAGQAGDAAGRRRP